MARKGDRIGLAATEPEAPTRFCDEPGCGLAGDFRAPRDRTALNEYRWFCLDHVRAYNRAWDYYKGMGPGEIEANLRADAGWQRPTWPLGRLGGANPFDGEHLIDPLGVLGATPLHQARRERQKRPDEPPGELRASVELLGLTWPVDATMLRARYKVLAKRYHPDVNGGDRSAEEKLKDINRAYSLLRRSLPAALSERARAAASA